MFLTLPFLFPFLFAAAADLLAICLHTDPTANYSAYIPSALTVCYSNKDRSEDPVNLIGMKVFLQPVRVTLHG